MIGSSSKELTRRALITGAATGLGREIALTLARDGYDVGLADRDKPSLDKLMNHPDLENVNTIPVSIELLSEESINEGFSDVINGLGGLDVLVNNAAKPLIKQAIDVTWDEWDDVLHINLKGSFFLACLLADHCIQNNKPGSIVNISSTHGLTGISGRTIYGISKGGMNQMTRMLAIEWAQTGVRVNTVAPSTILTESRKEMLKDPEVRQRMLNRIPTGEFPEPSEVAAAVKYLASKEAKSVTGHILVVDGGLTAA